MKDIRQEFWESPTVVKSFIDRPPSSYITKVLDYFIKNNPDWKVLALSANDKRKILKLLHNTIPMSQKQASEHNGLKRCANLYQNKTAHHG